MHVVHTPRSSKPRSRLAFEKQIDRVERLSAAAARARGRAAALCQLASCEQARARDARLSSRPHSQYARVQGTIDGKLTIGIIRRDGTVSGDPGLLRRVDLVVALGDSFGDGRLVASAAGDPLVSTLTTTRACDRVSAVDVYGMGGLGAPRAIGSRT